MTETTKKFNTTHIKNLPLTDGRSLPDTSTDTHNRKCPVYTTISDETQAMIDAIISEPPPYSESIAKQTKLAEDLYLHYCNERQKSPWPVTDTLGEGFFVWLGLTGKYATTTMKTVILPAVCRLNLRYTKQRIPSETVHLFVIRIDSMRGKPGIKRPSGGDEAIIVDDVYRMIVAMDPQDPKTPSIASLLLFSLSTGARGNSCGAITVKDIISVKPMPDKSTLVTIRICKLKAHPEEELELSLSGFSESSEPLDFIQWFEKHIFALLNIKLSELKVAALDEDTRSKLIWNYSTASMTQMVKRRMRWAGLPTDKMGFHSLRHGFLSCAKTYQESQNKSNQSVMEQAAMFANWIPFGSTQYGY